MFDIKFKNIYFLIQVLQNINFETSEMNNIQQYKLPTYEQDTQRASGRSYTYKSHKHILCNHPQANNTDSASHNTVPHNKCPHGSRSSAAKSVHIIMSITVLYPQCIKLLQVPIFLFCVVLLFSLELPP